MQCQTMQSVADYLLGFAEYRGRNFSMTEDAIRGVIREVVEHSNGLVMILALRH